MEQKNLGQRLKDERNRLGLSQQGLADYLSVAKATIQNWEGAGGRETQIPADKLETCAKRGMDVQYVLTGTRSTNLDRVAEETGTYKVEKGVGTLSREEEVLVEKYRHLKPGDRTRAQAIFDALATTQVKKKDVS